MATRIIISYDDTDNDRDALGLGRLLADTGARVSLAYVRHATEEEQGREQLQEHEAGELLRRGAAALGRPDADCHVIISPSTGEGLGALAEAEGADVIVFGSDYRTPPGNVRPGTSAQRLMENGPAALALAPAGLRETEALVVSRIGLLADDGTGAARATAEALATALGAQVVSATDSPIDLLVVGSRPEAPQGRVNVSAASAYAIETSTCPVLVVPHGVTVPFGGAGSPPASAPDPEPAAA